MCERSVIQNSALMVYLTIREIRLGQSSEPHHLPRRYSTRLVPLAVNPTPAENIISFQPATINFFFTGPLITLAHCHFGVFLGTSGPRSSE